MIYHRTFKISAAHFNSTKAYQLLWAFRDWSLSGKSLDRKSMEMGVLEWARDCHGHNFKIEVAIAAELSADWLIDDIELEKTVMEWNNINISIHPDFLELNLRATTENMALILSRKIAILMTSHLNARVQDGAFVHVKVHETDDIYAEFETEVVDAAKVIAEEELEDETRSGKLPN